MLVGPNIGWEDNKRHRLEAEMQRIELGDVRYNAKQGAFEARVDIHREGQVFRYPCEVQGPLDMDIVRVKQHLTQRAINMSDSPSRLHSHN